jgi:hypothetical protein
MALIRADRVKETSTSTGTGTIALAGAAAGYRTFAAVCSVGDTVYYGISNQTNGEWETGLGIYSAANTLTRASVSASSNSNFIVVFSSGMKEVFITLTASQLSSLASTNIEVFDNSLGINKNSDSLMWGSGINDVIAWS